MGQELSAYQLFSLASVLFGHKTLLFLLLLFPQLYEKATIQTCLTLHPRQHGIYSCCMCDLPKQTQHLLHSRVPLWKRISKVKQKQLMDSAQAHRVILYRKQMEEE